MLRTNSNGGPPIFRGIGLLASIVAIATMAFPWFSLGVEGQEGANYSIVAGRDLPTSLMALDDFTWLSISLLILWVVAGIWIFALAAGKSSSKTLGFVFFGSGAAGMVAGASLIAGVGAGTGTGAPLPDSMFVWSPAGGLMVALGACFAQFLCGIMLLKRSNALATESA